MNVVVTGGAGFIGSHIVDRLIEGGHTPIVIDNLCSGNLSNIPQNVKVYQVDICDRQQIDQIFAEHRPEAVTHQAAQMSVPLSVRDPHFDAQNNVIGLINVLDAAAKHGTRRFVFASSGGVLYGDVSEPAPETTTANPISPYGITKWVGERYLEFFAREHGLETVALRYANVYGQRQNPHGEAGVVAIFSKLSLKGEAVRVNGDGKYDRDYVHAFDVSRANYLCLTQPVSSSFQAFNIGTGVKTDVNQLAAIIREECQTILKNKGSDIVVPEATHGPSRAGDLRSNVVDAGLIKSTYGWEPTLDMKAGLAQTTAWFAEHC